NPRSLSYDPVVAALLHPTSLVSRRRPRYGSSVHRLCPCRWPVSFRPNLLHCLPSSYSVPCYSRFSSAQAARKPREEERPRLEKPREEGLNQRGADASQVAGSARRRPSCLGRGRP
uniref:Uncharacterized protein n=1 Tax=Aegilops tauschii subsp. strangulata TaxID=200361 RepID=A0A453LZL0_AEGTS